MMALPWMMGICGPYMASAQLILSMVIGQFLIWFSPLYSFSDCVDGYPTSFWSIIAASTTLISRLWKY